MDDMNNEKDRRKEKREQFIDDLMGFHAAVGTPLMRLPIINGHVVDLLDLYEEVTSLGGWERVSDNNQWPEVNDKLALPTACVNSTVALKQIYLRFLDKYEKTHFVHKVRGEPEDEMDFNIKRMNKQSARSLFNVPTTYNDVQHNLTEEQRILLGLNSLNQPDKFDKLQLSLLSPLPNEQDFAINTCALLSIHAFDKPVDLRDSSRLLYSLLAHAGVFTDVFFRDFFCEHYEKDRGHEMKNFWRDSLKHDSFVWFNNEANFPDYEDGDCLMADVPERSYASENLTNCDFFIQRVCQIGRIILNLTQHADNATFFAGDITTIRFILLCVDCRYKNISDIGWSILTNIACKICLRTLGLEELTFIVREGVLSEDVSEVLSSLRTLCELAKVEMNKKSLLQCLDEETFSRLCTYMTLQDVIIILCTLEALYSLSSLDKVFCDKIVHTTGSLSILVLLLKFRVPLSASFGTWKNIRISESIWSEDGSRPLADKDLGALSVRPPEFSYPYYLNGQPEVYRREIIPNCCATGECRRNKEEPNPGSDVITLNSPPRKNSLLSNALRNSMPNGVKPVTVSTVGPAVTLKAHLEEPVTKIVKISNPGNQSLINTVKNMSHNNPELLKNVAFVAKKVTLNGQDFVVATPCSPPRSEESKPSNSEEVQDKIVTSNHMDSEPVVPSKNNEEKLQNHSEPDSNSTPEKVNSLKDTNAKGIIGESDVNKTPVVNGMPEEAKVNGLSEPDEFLCEWRGCLRKFNTTNKVFSHICTLHCPQTMLEGKCLWGSCTAGKMVYRILVKHILREHCQPENLLPIKARTAVRPRPSPAARRLPPPPVPPPPTIAGPPTELTQSPGPAALPGAGTAGASTLMPPPQQIPSGSSVATSLPHPPHPQYGGQFIPRPYYGPPPLASTAAGDRISESIRLTAALIIRNIASSCPAARRRLLLYEQQIVEAAAFESEASRAAAECLSYLWT